jgi:hypothetical protein
VWPDDGRPRVSAPHPARDATDEPNQNLHKAFGTDLEPTRRPWVVAGFGKNTPGGPGARSATFGVSEGWDPVVTLTKTGVRSNVTTTAYHVAEGTDFVCANLAPQNGGASWGSSSATVIARSLMAAEKGLLVVQTPGGPKSLGYVTETRVAILGSGFIDGADFVEVSPEIGENRLGGRPTKEYP